MKDSLKNLFDKILYAAAIALVVIFALGIILSVGSMTRISLWMLMFVGAAISGMQAYEYLWRNKDESKDKMLLIELIATVLMTLLVISFTIFVLNGKLVTLPV